MQNDVDRCDAYSAIESYQSVLNPGHKQMTSWVLAAHTTTGYVTSSFTM